MAVKEVAKVISSPIKNKAASEQRYIQTVMQNMTKDLDEGVAAKAQEYMLKALDDGVAAGEDRRKVLSWMRNGYVAALKEEGGLSTKEALTSWRGKKKNYAENMYNGTSGKRKFSTSNIAGTEITQYDHYQNPLNRASYEYFRDSSNSVSGIKGEIKWPAAGEITETVTSDAAQSGGSFDPYKSYLEKHKNSVSHVAHHNRIKQKADNFQAEYDTMVENGADEKAKIALARKYGINIKPGENIQEAANAHFGKKLEADPSLWDKAVGHNVPAKATALGLTGGAVLAMANSRGQKSNAELYGV